MKTTKWMLIFAISFSSLLFFACDDDDNGLAKKGNHFSYDGKTYELSQGMLINFGQWWGEGYNFDLILLSDGITLNVQALQASGTGDGMYFEFFSPSASELAPGTYRFDPDDSGRPNSFYDADLFINYNMTTDTGLEVYIEGGSVEVEKSGQEYMLTFDVTTEAGKPVTGYYRGVIPVVNWDKDAPNKDVEKQRFMN